MDLSKDDEAFVRAAAAAYVWVSCSDGPLTEIEINCFIDFLIESPYVDQISEEDFSEIYLNLVDLFENDYAKGKERAVLRLSVFSERKNQAISIFKIARKALTADSQLNEREEIVLSEIASLLNIDESLLGD